VYALQNHARLALQLTRHFDEAMKAGALAERSRISHGVHDTLVCLTGIPAFANPNIELSIEDDGIGFRSDTPTIPEGFGFSTIRRRASRIGAKFTRRTSPETGTAIGILTPGPAWSYRL
jgi:signal transduction histidine kinase